MRIDSHHHLWNYSPEEYGWISPAMSVLKKDFTLDDLKQETRQAGIDGVIPVQARQTVAETERLLDLAETNGLVKGVVGWLPLASPEISSLLERFSSRRLLVAVRHVIQDEPADDFILGSAFNEGVRLLAGHRLVYDILIVERQLPQAIRFVDLHPDQQFVLDHCAKPRIAAGETEPWTTNIRELAKRPNVACKISGLVTEADTRKDLRDQCLPYVETALEAFGPDRCMFGSDWPVCLLACVYARWYGILSGFASKLPRAEQDALFGGNAERIYKLQEVR